MPALPTAVSDLIIVGIADDTGDSPPSAPTTYLYVYPNGTRGRYDPKNKEINVSVRNPIQTRANMPTLGEPDFTIQGPLTSDIFATMASLGMHTDGSGYVVDGPTPQAIFMGYEGVSSNVFGKQRCIRQTYNFSPTSEATFQWDFQGIVVPTPGDAIATVEQSMHVPFMFDDIDPIDLIATAGRTDCQQFSLVLDFMHARAPGNIKQASYAFMRFRRFNAGGTISVLHRGMDEFNALLASTIGGFAFSATQVGGAHFGASFAKIKYNTDFIDNREGEFVTEPLPFSAHDEAAAQLVTITASA